MTILNIHGDFLWSLGDRSQPPFIATPTATAVQPDKEPASHPETVEEKEQSASMTVQADNDTEEVSEALTTKLNVREETPTLGEPEADSSASENEGDGIDHEQLLEECFLIAVKFKDIKVPIIVSTFAKTMQTCWYVVALYKLRFF